MRAWNINESKTKHSHFCIKLHVIIVNIIQVTPLSRGNVVRTRVFNQQITVVGSHWFILIWWHVRGCSRWSCVYPKINKLYSDQTPIHATKTCHLVTIISHKSLKRSSILPLKWHFNIYGGMVIVNSFVTSTNAVNTRYKHTRHRHKHVTSTLFQCTNFSPPKRLRYRH